MSDITKPELFIIESLTLDDEKQQRQEGEIISRLLRLAGKTKTKYFYIRTRRELDEFIDLFDELRYRYLHISCHANAHEMATTFDDIPYADLGAMLGPCLKGRRVFVSACQMASKNLARHLLGDTGCYSLIGPQKDITFDDAAAFWVSFYHLMFKVDDLRMKGETLRAHTKQLEALYGEPINYFTRSNSANLGFRLVDNKRAK